jgi:hypothetical protein
VLKKARKRIKVKTNRHGFGKGSTVVWSIDARIGAIGASPENPVSMAPIAAPMHNGNAVQSSPPGAPTDRTPGMTDRVYASLAKAAGRPPICPDCQRAPARTDTGICDLCSARARKQAVAEAKARLDGTGA